MGTSPAEAPGATAPLAANQAVIIGDLVAKPESRVLPSGGELVSFSLTVRIADMASTSVPMVWYDPPARIARWQPGETIVAAGPVVRRFYQAGGAVASRTEVTVAHAYPARYKAARQILVRQSSLLSDLVASFDR